MRPALTWGFRTGTDAIIFDGAGAAFLTSDLFPATLLVEWVGDFLKKRKKLARICNYHKNRNPFITLIFD